MDLSVSTSILKNRPKPDNTYTQPTRYKVQRGTSTTEVEKDSDLVTVMLEPSRQNADLARVPSERKYTLNYFGNID